VREANGRRGIHLGPPVQGMHHGRAHKIGLYWPRRSDSPHIAVITVAALRFLAATPFVFRRSLRERRLLTGCEGFRCHLPMTLSGRINHFRSSFFCVKRWHLPLYAARGGDPHFLYAHKRENIALQRILLTLTAGSVTTLSDGP